MCGSPSTCLCVGQGRDRSHSSSRAQAACTDSQPRAVLTQADDAPGLQGPRSPDPVGTRAWCPGPLRSNWSGNCVRSHQCTESPTVLSQVPRTCGVHEGVWLCARTAALGHPPGREASVLERKVLLCHVQPFRAPPVRSVLRLASVPAACHHLPHWI